MGKFFKAIFTSCLGTMLALACIVVFTLLIVSLSTPKETIASNSILHLKFNGPIPELSDNIPSGQFNFQSTQAVGLHDILQHLKNAKDDASIKGILIQPESVAANPTTAYPIAMALSEFKESGKFVYAYGDFYTQSGYILAAVADTIYLNPNGLIDLRGYGSARPYYKNMADKLGVNFDVYYAGKYKSAIEPYYRSESSENNKYQSRKYLNNFHESLVEHIAHYRNQKDNYINEIITEGNSNNSEDAITLNLADHLAYFQEVKKLIKDKFDVDEDNYVSLNKYHQTRALSRGSSNNEIAVIIAEGEVAYGTDNKGEINIKNYEGIFDDIENDDDIKGVILRVNSPGGSSFTSDVIWQRIEQLKNKGKYVVASFGDYAASGGYYIAAGADKIVSEPNTLTGSIGVFSMIPDFSQLSEDKIGINWDTTSTSKRTFLYSSFVKRSNADNLLLQSETNRIYEQFKAVVAKGRNMTVDAVDEIAQGFVWTGNDAIEAGLVDTLGSLQTAAEIIVAEKELDNYKLKFYPRIEKSVWDSFFADIMNEAQSSMQLNDISQFKISENMIKIMHEIDRSCQEPQMRLPHAILMQ